ncbi:hypothetical protein K466DRAFT_543888 [Polyporus arcularius HHB13444]|uniref:Ubiquitin-like protease family profile domain-containing protein n=1 Tax=Polyporus arcularius HHB13444 TaxID=1314778 RepID=A0A5C3PKX5_9APHY|nr:hypothetical protein K466DRAFT_543888 [Polyporus arcularius HHB13444]
MEVLYLRRGDGPYQAWLRAENWVVQRRKTWSPSVPKTNHLIVNKVLTLLSLLPWSATLSGFSNHEPMETLTRYLSRAWLSDVHENQLLDILRTKLMRRVAGHVVELETTYLWRSLEAAFQGNDRDRYRQHGAFSRLRGLGELLATGERHHLGLLVNRRNTHWVAIVVDFPKAEILFGDSLGHAPDPELMATMSWWLNCHTASPFSWRSLKITRQNDAHSCGVLSWNALAHYLLPDEYALAGLSPHDTDGLRMQMLLEVGRRHLDTVSPTLHVIHPTEADDEFCRVQRRLTRATPSL